MKTSPAFRLSLLALACAALAQPAMSQEQPASAPQKVEITGSRIKRIDAEGASPVQVLKREELEATGATTVREMLDSLASSSGGLSDIGGSNSFAPGATAASLRNLGKQSTLVLLNGRRIAAYPLADYQEIFSNIDTLPGEAVDRIEILKNGGSSLYGSDAMAGVINIITRKDYQGIQVDASERKSLRNGEFKSRDAALTAGFGDFARDGWNVLGNIEAFHRDGFFWREVLDDVNPAYKKVSASFGSFSTYSYPGNIIGQGPLDGCATVIGGLCRYDRYQRFQVVPDSSRVNSLLSGRLRLDGDKEAYGEVLLSNIRTGYKSAFQTYGAAASPITWTDPNTLQPLTFYYRGLPAEHPLNQLGEEAEFRYRFVDAPTYNNADTFQYRALTGLKGSLSAWDWDVAVGAMGGNTDNKQRGAFSNSGFKSMIGDYNKDTLDADFFNKSGGYQIGKQNSDSVLSTLFPEYGFKGKVTQVFADGKISGDVGQLPGGPIALALGYDLRHESMSVTPSDRIASGDMVGYGTSASSASRSFGALFGEADLPITKELEGQVAARLDKFPGFGAHLSPKLGLRFQPAKEVMFRATAETGFRAPNLSESAPSTKLAFETGVSDPQRCPQATALANDLTAQADALPDTDPNKPLLYARADQVQTNECSAGVANITANNPTLKPETSRSFNLGMVLQPAAKWSTTVDYWNIERRNEIGLKSTQDLLSVESTLPAGEISRGTLANDPTFSAAEQTQYGVTKGAIVSLTNRFENLFKTKTSGLDFSVKGELPTPFVPVEMDVDATYTINYQVFSAAINRYGLNLSGRYGLSKWLVNTTWTIKTGDFTHSMRWAYAEGTKLVGDFTDENSNFTAAGCASQKIAASDCRVKNSNRWDYNLGWNPMKSLHLGLHIGNVFQQRPPVDYNAFGGSAGIIPSSLTDAEGRTAKLSASYKF